MSRRNSHYNKQLRRALRKIERPDELPYLFVVGDEQNTPGTYYAADIRAVLVTRCMGEDCCSGDYLVAAITNNERHLILEQIPKAVHEARCGDCNATHLKMWAVRHGIPDCVHGSGDAKDPIRGWCSRDHMASH